MPDKRKPTKHPGGRIRVRSKTLPELDETKLALAFWLMAKRQLEDEQREAESDSAP